MTTIELETLVSNLHNIIDKPSTPNIPSTPSTSNPPIDKPGIVVGGRYVRINAYVIDSTQIVYMVGNRTTGTKADLYIHLKTRPDKPIIINYETAAECVKTIDKLREYLGTHTIEV